MDVVTHLYDVIKLFFGPQQLLIFLSTLVWSTFMPMTSSVCNILLLLYMANSFLLFKSTALQFSTKLSWISLPPQLILC